MPKIVVDDGCKINVEVDGPADAPALMLSNSLGTNLHRWDQQTPEFAKHYRVIRYDRRGHGQSDVPDLIMLRAEYGDGPCAGLAQEFPGARIDSSLVRKRLCVVKKLRTLSRLCRWTVVEKYSRSPRCSVKE